MATVYTVNDWKGIMVKVGLGQPSSRAFVIATLATGIAYITRMPQASFREDGSMKAFKLLSPEPDATLQHFLLVPVAAATAAYLFT